MNPFQPWATLKQALVQRNPKAHTHRSIGISAVNSVSKSLLFTLQRNRQGNGKGSGSDDSALMGFSATWCVLLLELELVLLVLLELVLLVLVALLLLPLLLLLLLVLLLLLRPWQLSPTPLPPSPPCSPRPVTTSRRS